MAGSWSQSGSSIRCRSRRCSRSERTLNAVAASSTRSAPSTGARWLRRRRSGRPAGRATSARPGGGASPRGRCRAPRARGSRGAAPVLSRAHSCGSAQPFPQRSRPRRWQATGRAQESPRGVPHDDQQPALRRGPRYPRARRPVRHGRRTIAMAAAGSRPAAARCRGGGATRASSPGWCVLLVVTALWVKGGGVQQLHVGVRRACCRRAGSPAWSPPTCCSSRCSSWPGCRGSSRPSARTGWPAWHRLVGFTSFTLMLAHIVLITLGLRGAGAEPGLVGHDRRLRRQLPRHAARRRRHRRPGHGRRDLGGKARRRLRYESWHLLHLYAYLGVGLALPHQLWTGTDFLSSTGRDRVLVEAVRRVRRRGARLPARAAARGAPCAHRCASRRRAEAPGVTSVISRPGRAPAAGARRPVLPVAVPRRAGLDPGPPVLAVGRPRRADPADHRGGPRRRRRPRLATLRPGTRVLLEGPYGGLHAGCAPTARCSCMALGHRHHADAGPARGARPGPRRRHPRATGCAAAEAVLRRRARRARRGPRRPPTCSSRARACPTAPAGCPPQARHVGDARRCAQLVPDIAAAGRLRLRPRRLDDRRARRRDRGRGAARRRAPRALHLLTPDLTRRKDRRAPHQRLRC